ncbi:MAG: DNA (cytosine-5-)-methyltransferase [Alphaproteobacteria bacterium]|nr:DNA (cytosine-5-)-methyltransferase [Alphaproteobacteria bacterium]
MWWSLTLMNYADDIKQKRLSLGLTQKDFADALGLGKYGDRTLRRWENNETTPSLFEYRAVMSFATETPYIKTNRENLFTFIDLFAGIGGIRIPFQELGGKCVFSSEWDSFAQKTYRVNFGEIPSGDITKIDAKTIPNFDVLLAGFPCQPFSQAGLKKGFSDTRGTLFFDIERIIAKKRPKAFLLENVKQLQGHDRGNTLKVIIEHLKKLNYTVDYKVLRAADFGLPQNRERLYIVGFNKDIFKLPKNFTFEYPNPTYQKTRLGDILENKIDDKYTISDKLYEGHLRRKQEHIAKGNGFGFSLFNENSPYTNTISARYYKDGSEILIEQKNKNPRKLTPRECARLQGFPETFIIPVSDTQAYKQFGNSVAVPVVRAIAKHLLKILLKI